MTDFKLCPLHSIGVLLLTFLCLSRIIQGPFSALRKTLFDHRGTAVGTYYLSQSTQKAKYMYIKGRKEFILVNQCKTCTHFQCKHFFSSNEETDNTLGKVE